MHYQTDQFINNEYVSATSGQKLSIHNPSDDTLVTDQVQVASEDDVNKAVAAAKAAFKPWAARPGKDRAACMLKFADLLEKHSEKLATLESICMGVPIANAAGVGRGPANLWRFYASYAGRIAGESYPPDGDGIYKIVQYEPLGVCAGIAAWNATHTLAAWKMAPALASGNTFVFKPSEKSPLGALAYGDLIKEAGFPPGVINIVTGAGSVGALLASHLQIAKIAFTGSAPAGRAVQIAAAKSNMKHVSLELGGKSPALVFNDADIDNAVEHTSTGFLRNSGQICFAASRILVQEGVAPKYIEKLKAAFEKARDRMGPSSEKSTGIGPLADKAQLDRVLGFLDEAKSEGVDIPVGGGRLGDKGTFVQPTVLMNPSTKSRVYTDEIFGPVVLVKTFKTEEEGIEMANDTTYGLGAAIYTSDVSRALRVASAVEAGTVAVNSSFGPSIQTPFGGIKESGYGRESGMEGLKGYVNIKTIHVNLNTPKRE